MPAFFWLRGVRKRELLREAEAYLRAETRCCPPVGIRYQWFVHGAFEVQLDIQLLIHHVADIRTQLKVNIAVRDGIQLVYLSLDRFCIAQRHIHPEGKIIL